MRITIVGTAYPFRGGLAEYNQRLAREFMSQGHDVNIINFTLQYPSIFFPGKTQYDTEPAPEGLKIQRLLNSCNPVNWWTTGRKIAQDAPDLCVIGFWLPFMAPCLGSVARMARTNGKTKVVSVIHNMIPHEKRIGDTLFAKYFTGSVDGFVAMSDLVMNDVNSFDATKPRRICPHPVYDNFGKLVDRSEAMSKLRLSADKRYILFFGLIRDYKGLDMLLKAFADDRIDKEKYGLIVAGEFYNNQQKYEQLSADLQLDGKVEWHTRFIPDSEVKYYFSAADCIVQPYRDATQSGITQVAYNFEKAMIVTRVGALPEIVPDGKVGMVVEPNEKAIADGLVQFFSLGNPEFYHDGILEEKKKYQWDHLADTIVAVAADIK